MHFTGHSVCPRSHLDLYFMLCSTGQCVVTSQPHHTLLALTATATAVYFTYFKLYLKPTNYRSLINDLQFCITLGWLSQPVATHSLSQSHGHHIIEAFNPLHSVLHCHFSSALIHDSLVLA